MSPVFLVGDKPPPYARNDESFVRGVRPRAPRSKGADRRSAAHGTRVFGGKQAPTLRGEERFDTDRYIVDVTITLCGGRKGVFWDSF